MARCHTDGIVSEVENGSKPRTALLGHKCLDEVQIYLMESNGSTRHNSSDATARGVQRGIVILPLKEVSVLFDDCSGQDRIQYLYIPIHFLHWIHGQLRSWVKQGNVHKATHQCYNGPC